MNSKEITSLAFKLLAIYVLVGILSQVGQFSMFFRNFFQYDSTWFYFLPVITIGVLVALFFLLWNLSNKVIVSSTNNEEVDDNLKVDQVFILSLVGFYLLPQGIFDLIRILMSDYFSNHTPPNISFNTDSGHMLYVYIAASLMKIIISLSLIFKTKGWAILFKKIRYLGR
jgi:hypothetical protein